MKAAPFAKLLSHKVQAGYSSDNIMKWTLSMKNRLLPSTLAIVAAIAVPGTVLVAQNMQQQQYEAQQIEDLEAFLAVYRKVKSS